MHNPVTAVLDWLARHPDPHHPLTVPYTALCEYGHLCEWQAVQGEGTDAGYACPTCDKVAAR